LVDHVHRRFHSRERALDELEAFGGCADIARVGRNGGLHARGLETLYIRFPVSRQIERLGILLRTLQQSRGFTAKLLERGMYAGSALGERMHLALELAGLALPIESLVLRRDLGEANTIDEVLGGAGGSRRSVTRSSRGRGRYWGGIRRSAICSIGGRCVAKKGAEVDIG
jgi:hypothetical protein